MTEMHRRSRLKGAIDPGTTGFPSGDPQLMWWAKYENPDPLHDFSGNAISSTKIAPVSYTGNAKNGLPAISLSASAYNIGLSAASGSFSMVAVLNPTSSNKTYGQYLLDSQTGRFIFAPACNAGSYNQVGWYDGAWHQIAAATTGWQILTWVLTSGGNGEVFRNGTSLGVVAYTAKAIGGTTRAFCAYGSIASTLTGEVGEILLFGRALSSDDRARVEAYLNSKWAIY